MNEKKQQDKKKRGPKDVVKRNQTTLARYWGQKKREPNTASEASLKEMKEVISKDKMMEEILVDILVGVGLKVDTSEMIKGRVMDQVEIAIMEGELLRAEVIWKEARETEEMEERERNKGLERRRRRTSTAEE